MTTFGGGLTVALFDDDAGATGLAGVAPAGDLAVLDQPVESEDGVHERLGARRAARRVHVDRHDLVDTLHDGVVVEHAATAGAHAHGDDPLGLGHLVVDLPQHRSHLLADPAGDDHEVGLAGRRPENLHAVASEVVVGSTGGHHLDRAAGQAEGGRPARSCPAPVDDVLDPASEEVVVEPGQTLVGDAADLADERELGHQAASSSVGAGWFRRPSRPTRRTVELEVRLAETSGDCSERRSGPHSSAPLPMR